jgi:hypothetical protein
MRILEKISRRLSLTLASAVACSAFAMPVAPAITTYAAEQEAGQINYNETFTQIKANMESKATELRNYADFTDQQALEEVPETGVTAKSYKIHSDIEGKLDVELQGAGKVGIYVWKAGDTTPSIYISKAEEELKSDVVWSNVNDTNVTEGDYYIGVVSWHQDCKASASVDIYANLNSSKIRKLTSPAKKIVNVKFKEVKDADGYEFRYDRSKKFDKKVKTKSVKESKIKFEKKVGSYDLKKLKSGKKYYVAVRTYIKKNGKKYYSVWSDYKKIKVK